MDSLVLSNIRQRPTRTLISMAGVALGVILVLLNTGLVEGVLNDRARRDQGVGAEIEFSRSRGSVWSPSSIMPLDVRYADRLRQIAGVKIVSPIGYHIQKGNSGFGFETVEGIDFDTYSAISGMRIVEGKLFASPDEVIIDQYKAEHSKLRVGDEIDVFGKKLKVAGIYTPEVGARIKLALSALQDSQSAPDKCTSIMIKVDDPAKQEEIQRRIDAELPGNVVVLRRDIVLGMSSRIPGIQGFVRAVMALSIVVSSLVILLAMYTTITERTREIGILKSLGASKSFIVGAIEREALVISLIGVVVGLIVSIVASIILRRVTTLQIEFHWAWVATAALIGFGAGALGALYPAIRAANQDPVKALAYE